MDSHSENEHTQNQDLRFDESQNIIHHYDEPKINKFTRKMYKIVYSYDKTENLKGSKVSKSNKKSNNGSPAYSSPAKNYKNKVTILSISQKHENRSKMAKSMYKLDNTSLIVNQNYNGQHSRKSISKLVQRKKQNFSKFYFALKRGLIKEL